MTRDYEQYTAFKKNFIAEYKAFMQDKNYSYPKELAGLCAISNSANAFDNYIPPPVVYGDEAKAIAWINEQSLQEISDKNAIENIDKISKEMSENK